jgi:hypothetical protein
LRNIFSEEELERLKNDFFRLHAKAFEIIDNEETPAQVCLV